jgi:pullulanase
MTSRGYSTSRLTLAFAACAGMLLAGCGAGDSDTATRSGATAATRLLATAGTAAPAVAPGSIRMHFHRVQNDASQE